MSELRMEREFKADPEMVFAFVTRPENILKWWGPEGMSVTEHHLDFTTPGPWSSVFVSAEGNRFRVTGEVIDVEPPHSVELTWAWHDESDVRGHESRVRFQVSPHAGGGTLLTLVHSGLADEESARNHEGGWTSSLLKLERMDA